MRFDIMTLFPDLVRYVLSESVIGRAQKSGAITVQAHNIRDYSQSKHSNTDDYPFGGGAGMVMMAQPIFSCLDAVDPNHEALRIVMAPRGKTLNVATARELAKKDRLLFLCGHYEGIDERAMEQMDMEMSIGDYVLTGGELPAMVCVDCLSRFIPGVLGSADSAEEESFSDGLLEYPQYTRPAVFRGMEVPEVLLNGNHALIAKWRRERSIETTYRVRPELIDESTLDKKEKLFLQGLKNQQNNQ